MLVADTHNVYQKIKNHDFLMEMSLVWRQLRAGYISLDLPYLQYENTKEMAEHRIQNELDEDAMWKVYDV